MSRRRRSKLEDLTPRLGEDEAVDPSTFFDRRSQRRVDRKAYQLCRQVSDTLNYVLSGDTGDDVLRGLYVESVDPAPDSSRLLQSSRGARAVRTPRSMRSPNDAPAAVLQGDVTSQNPSPICGF